MSTVRFAPWLFVVGIIAILTFVYMQHKLIRQMDSDFEALRLDVDMTKAEVRALGIKINNGLFSQHAPELVEPVNSAEPVEAVEAAEPAEAVELTGTKKV